MKEDRKHQYAENTPLTTGFRNCNILRPEKFKPRINSQSREQKLMKGVILGKETSESLLNSKCPEPHTVLHEQLSPELRIQLEILWLHDFSV